MSEEAKRIELAEVLEFVRSRGAARGGRWLYATLEELSEYFGERAKGDLNFKIRGPRLTCITILEGMSSSLRDVLRSEAFKRAVRLYVRCYELDVQLALRRIDGRRPPGRLPVHRYKNPQWNALLMCLRQEAIQ